MIQTKRCLDGKGIYDKAYPFKKSEDKIYQVLVQNQCLKKLQKIVRCL